MFLIKGIIEPLAKKHFTLRFLVDFWMDLAIMAPLRIQFKANMDIKILKGKKLSEAIPLQNKTLSFGQCCDLSNSPCCICAFQQVHSGICCNLTVILNKEREEEIHQGER